MELVETRILPYTDFQRATALVTGRHWHATSPFQQQQLAGEFRRLLMYIYSGTMPKVRDQQIDVKCLRWNMADTEVVVRSDFRKSRGAEPIQVSYRLVKHTDDWKIYDVNVMGVWVGLTYKESFAELNKGGIDGLIQTLANENRELATRTEARSGRGITAS